MDRRVRKLAALLVVVVVAALAASCGPPTSAVIGDGARVTVESDPLRVRIGDGFGKDILTILGVHTATDLYVEETQVLPGWDGYVEGVDAWLPASTGVIVERDPNRVVIDLQGDATGRLVVTANGARVRLHAEMNAPLGFAPQKSSMTFDLKPDESFFGMGERFASLDHRGHSLYSWAEEGGLGTGEDPEAARGGPKPNGPSMTYFPVPFAISSEGYAVHLDTTLRTEMHFGSESNSRWRAAINGGVYDVVVYVAPPLAALDLYTEDTGRPPIPAPWVFGPRRRVSPGQQVDGVDEWRLLRERRVPTTGIDDSVHFLPHLSHAGIEDVLAAWVNELHDNGFKVMAYNNPYVSTSIETARPDFEYGRDNGLFLLDEAGQVAETFFISGEPQTLATIDLTNPQAVEWFQSLLQRTLDLGYDGWMHDFGEYTERGWTAFDGSLGEELHNRFPVLSAKAAYELMERERPGDYLFFVRSGYSGTQAFVPAVWGGDAEATFDDTQGIPSALRSGLSLGMSGVPYWGSDVTGFKCITNDAPRDKEVYLRWAALGAVSPIFMEQNACANPFSEQTKWTLWSDEETTEVYGNFARLHTRLQPYFLILANEAHETGAPIMRHPFLLHPNDPDARRVEEAFYLGNAIYAAPVVRRGQTVKRTWIPPGRLVDVADGRVYSGGVEVEIPAPLQKLPLLLVEGQMVPLLDESIETLAETDHPDVITPSKVADVLDVWVSLSTGGSSLTLVDGTELSIEPTSEASTSTGVSEPLGDVELLKVSTSSSAVVDGLRFSVNGPIARTVRFTVYRLP